MLRSLHITISVLLLTSCVLNSQERYITIPANKPQQIIVVENISAYDIRIDRVNTLNKPLSSGWSTYLQSNRFSGLILEESQDFILGCQQQKIQDYWEPVICEDVINLSSIQANIPLKHNHSIWIAENLSYERLLLAYKEAGITW